MPSRRFVVFAVMWPVLVLVLGLGIYVKFTGSAGPAKRAGYAPRNSPRGVVEALWALQDERQANMRRLMRVDDISGLLTQSAKLSLGESVAEYSDRQVNTEEQLDANRWRITATFTISRTYRDDGGPTTRRRAYIVVKDAGQWMLAEVWAECFSCDGKGSTECFLCKGTGRLDYAGTCDECGGTGRIKCTTCKGSGWTDELKGLGFGL